MNGATIPKPIPVETPLTFTEQIYYQTLDLWLKVVFHCCEVRTVKNDGKLIFDVD